MILNYVFFYIFVKFLAGEKVCFAALSLVQFDLIVCNLFSEKWTVGDLSFYEILSSRFVLRRGMQRRKLPWEVS